MMAKRRERTLTHNTHAHHQQSKQTIPIQFCRAAPHFMGDWARHAFAGEEEGRAIESLLEFCGVFPFSGLPDALGKRCDVCFLDWVGWVVDCDGLTAANQPLLTCTCTTNTNRVEAHVERLMGEGREQQALALIRRCLEAPWAEHQKIWWAHMCVWVHACTVPLHPVP